MTENTLKTYFPTWVRRVFVAISSGGMSAIIDRNLFVRGNHTRALLHLFIPKETPPFYDGNERIAHLAMNAELSRAGECRIIIPTVYRDPYND